MGDILFIRTQKPSSNLIVKEVNYEIPQGLKAIICDLSGTTELVALAKTIFINSLCQDDEP